jgi:hypothetical protein
MQNTTFSVYRMKVRIACDFLEWSGIDSKRESPAKIEGWAEDRVYSGSRPRRSCSKPSRPRADRTEVIDHIPRICREQVLNGKGRMELDEAAGGSRAAIERGNDAAYSSAGE